MATYSTENNFAFVFKENGQEIVLLPKTVAQQVDCLTGTALDHVNSNVHLTKFDIDAVKNYGRANGLVVLDSNGYVPLENFDPSMMQIKIEKSNITELLADSTVLTGAFVMVIDATGDPTVNNGWAVYRRSSSVEYNSLERGWVKIAENESLDIEATWDTFLPTGPQKPVEEIDEAVELRHSHLNKEVLDEISVDATNHLTYKGNQIGFVSDVVQFFNGDYVDDEDVRDGDFWLKPSIGQVWWTDPSVDESPTDLYQAYHDASTMVTAPRLRTSSCTTMRRMFYRCYSLKEIPQYDMGNVVDLYGWVEECSELETVPAMNNSKATTLDRMFYGCTKLRYSPEMNLLNANLLVSMFSGCVNLTRILPMGSTANVSNYSQMFSGCTALETIDTVLDFSNVVVSANVNNMFYDCIELRDLTIAANTIKVPISFSGTNLTHKSLLSVLNGLADIRSGDSGIIYTVDLSDIPEANYLTAEEQQIATNKGWQIRF